VSIESKTPSWSLLWRGYRTTAIRGTSGWPRTGWRVGRSAEEPVAGRHAGAEARAEAGVGLRTAGDQAEGRRRTTGCSRRGNPARLARGDGI